MPIFNGLIKIATPKIKVAFVILLPIIPPSESPKSRCWIANADIVSSGSEVPSATNMRATNNLDSRN